jgi:hypothetical protein
MATPDSLLDGFPDSRLAASGMTAECRRRR